MLALLHRKRPLSHTPRRNQILERAAYAEHPKSATGLADQRQQRRGEGRFAVLNGYAEMVEIQTHSEVYAHWSGDTLSVAGMDRMRLRNLVARPINLWT